MSNYDEFDDGYYEGDSDDLEKLDFEDEDEDYRELGEDGWKWDEGVERDNEDGWFYDDEDDDNIEKDGFSYEDEL